MKKILFFAIAFIVLAIITTTTQASAQKNTLMPMRDGSQAAQRQDKALNPQNIESLKQRADKEISRRIESLQKLLTRISEFKKLSAAQKTSLTTQVQAEITKLTALKAKIAATTDIATLKTDIASIVTSYRTFGLFMPKIQILGTADRMLTTSDVMGSQAARLETKLIEAQTAGKNVSDLQLLLVDMKAKIASAKTKAQSAIDTVTPLTPEGYPGNKTQLQSARQLVVAALQDLNTARQDARKIIVGLQKLGLAKDISVTPRVSCIPRPKCLDMTPACEIAEPTNGTWCPKSGQMCAQVLTPARNATTNQCKVFPTSCLETDWVKDTTCATTNTTAQ